MPRTYVRHGRRPGSTRSSLRVRQVGFIDPFPKIQGSSIEKMVMAEFVRRGIWFEHTPQSNTVGGYVDPSWEADFLLPQFRIWIEIQGSYFHSQPAAIKSDALRFASIEASGWRPIFWWEDDIRTRLRMLMDAVPEFYDVNPALNVGRTNLGLPFYEGGTGIDHLKGLRTALRNRRKAPFFTTRIRTKRRRA